METVLIVDDEPTIRDVVVHYLQREGFATLRIYRRHYNEHRPHRALDPWGAETRSAEARGLLSRR
jgi:CheY-like chemotaxis protein